MSETWPTNAALKRDHDQLLAELRNTRSDLNGLQGRVLEMDDEIGRARAELRDYKQHVAAEFARLAGETEADKSPIPSAALLPTVTGQLGGTAWLEDFEARAPDDPAQRDDDLIHVPCGQRVCTIEHGDTLTVLAQTAVAHTGDCQAAAEPAGLAAPQELEPAVEATARTLTYLAGWVGTDQQQAQLREMAKAVRDIDTRDICCPVCQEIQCDGGCPLYPVRLSWGCWVTSPAPARRECGLDAVEDCQGVVVWLWRPNGPGQPDQVYLCDEHAKDIDLSELEDLAATTGKAG